MFQMVRDESAEVHFQRHLTASKWRDVRCLTDSYRDTMKRVVVKVTGARSFVEVKNGDETELLSEIAQIREQCIGLIVKGHMTD